LSNTLAVPSAQVKAQVGAGSPVRISLHLAELGSAHILPWRRPQSGLPCV